MEIPQHLALLTRSAIAYLRRSHLLDSIFTWLAGRFTTWPADEFARFTKSGVEARLGAPERAALPPAAEPVRPPEPESIAPSTFERRFSQLHQEGRFDQMWAMLAEDAQRSWGSRQAFTERMHRQSAEFDLLDARVDGVDIVSQWTDRRGNRTYRNVACLDVRYRIRHGWREVTMDRKVHLVPAADGWRTLFYP